MYTWIINYWCMCNHIFLYIHCACSIAGPCKMGAFFKDLQSNAANHLFLTWANNRNYVFICANCVVLTLTVLLCIFCQTGT